MRFSLDHTVWRIFHFASPRADTVDNLPTYRWMKDYRSDWNFQGFNPWDFTIVPTLDPSDLSPSLSVFQAEYRIPMHVHSSSVITFHHHTFPMLPTSRSLCRILCFNITITVITFLSVPRAHPRTQQTNIRSGRSPLLS